MSPKRLILLPLLLLAVAYSKKEDPAPATPAAAPPPAQAAGPTPGSIVKDCPDCPEMVVIPPGNFFMGSPLDEADRGSDESPVHRIKIAKPFLLAKTEVTQKQWRAVMGGDPPELHFKGCDDCPVDDVSWDDAQEYLRALSAKTGKPYRLPAEAEWEYACRAGKPDHRYCGGDDLDTLAWYDKNSDNKTHPVALKKPNAFGLYDMSGNVWEWAQDCWNANYQGAPTDGGVWSAGDCARRVVRGGSWISNTEYSRAANRNVDSPAFRVNSLGFRPARTLP